ncbi:MAG: sugar phosphate isomerase/epimerase [Bacteroidales bacterium]|nr:sugar phosphate isomerase/epimerase [Bacteroidales bacterium]
MKKQLLSKVLFVAVAALFLVSCNSGKKPAAEAESQAVVEATPDFQISLAQWSLHKTYFGGAPDWAEFGRLLMEDPDALLKGEMDPFDFPKVAAGYGIYCIELVNTFYFSKANDMEYWEKFKAHCEEAGVTVGLIMCDALGNLGDADPEVRKATVENHKPWVDVAAFLGAKTIRVNAAGEGTAEEVATHAVDGLSRLGEYAATRGINVVVENHGGYSSDGKWLSGVMQEVGMDNVGTLPDFGNFYEYDRYLGMEELMPYAKGVSAKSNAFDAEGNEANMDYLRIMKIVKDSGFKGYVGIEYEGTELSEDEGIKATKALLEKVFAEI